MFFKSTTHPCMSLNQKEKLRITRLRTYRGFEAAPGGFLRLQVSIETSASSTEMNEKPAGGMMSTWPDAIQRRHPTGEHHDQPCDQPSAQRNCSSLHPSRRDRTRHVRIFRTQLRRPLGTIPGDRIMRIYSICFIAAVTLFSSAGAFAGTCTCDGPRPALCMLTAPFQLIKMLIERAAG